MRTDKLLDLVVKKNQIHEQIGVEFARCFPVGTRCAVYAPNGKVATVVVGQMVAFFHKAKVRNVDTHKEYWISVHNFLNVKP